MSKLPKRTAKDEHEYDESLRREEAIKTEVIAEFREHLKEAARLAANHMEALIAQGEFLRQALCVLQSYRNRELEALKQYAADVQAGHCVPTCTRHVWDNADGWHRKGE